jgi:CubicO group peptidase (beta-lactamase class C family)
LVQQQQGAGMVVINGAWRAGFVLLMVGPSCLAAQAQQANTSQRIAQVERGLLPPFVAANTRPMRLDDRMRHYQVPGLSVAVVDNGQLVWTQAWGVAQVGRRMDTQTLMQAASISKAVSAVAALRLVEAGKLGLDVDVNTQLRSWQIPPGAQTADKPVTLRRLLSHSAGFTVSGFRGYVPGSAVPTVLQVLNGLPPANSDPVRVDIAPGSEWRYSGGGFTVLQQLMVDVSGQPFAELMQKEVLTPAGMTHSSFALPADKLAQAATGHQNGQAIAGLRAVHPELAAAGLWTTPSDLALLTVALLHSLNGQAPQLLPALRLQEALSPQFGPSGLGFVLEGKDTSAGKDFGHNGSNAGFESRWLASRQDGGRAVVVMANANGAMPLMLEVIRAIAQAHGWADWQAPTQAQLNAKLESTPLFLRGSMNDWGLSQPMQRVGPDRYVVEVSLPAGPFEYKLATEDWGDVDLGADKDRKSNSALTALTLQGANVSFDAKEAGRYRFELDTRAVGGPRVRVRRLKS